jgi:cell division protein FtsB
VSGAVGGWPLYQRVSELPDRGDAADLVRKINQLVREVNDLREQVEYLADKDRETLS